MVFPFSQKRRGIRFGLCRLDPPQTAGAESAESLAWACVGNGSSLCLFFLYMLRFNAFGSTGTTPRLLKGCTLSKIS